MFVFFLPGRSYRVFVGPVQPQEARLARLSGWQRSYIQRKISGDCFYRAGNKSRFAVEKTLDNFIDTLLNPDYIGCIVSMPLQARGIG